MLVLPCGLPGLLGFQWQPQFEGRSGADFSPTTDAASQFTNPFRHNVESQSGPLWFPGDEWLKQ